MKEPVYFTVTGTSHYYGLKPLEPGRVIDLVKEPENLYDSEAIKVQLPYIDTIGYVANSAHTVAGGTFSAGRLYDKIADTAKAKVLFSYHDAAICVLQEENEAAAD